MLLSLLQTDAKQVIVDHDFDDADCCTTVQTSCMVAWVSYGVKLSRVACEEMSYRHQVQMITKH